MLDLTLHIGRVEVSNCFQNTYVVSTPSGNVTATALGSGSGRRGGHIGSENYVSGAVVLVAILDDDTFASNFLSAIILGSFDLYPVFEGTEFLANETVRGSKANILNNQFFNKILDSEYVKNIDQNRGGNNHLDVLPGEWFKSTVLGGVILLSEFLAKIGASPDCAISFSGIDHLLDITSKNMIQDHITYLRELHHSGQQSIDSSAFAYSIKEAIGGNNAFIESSDDPLGVDPSSDSITGLFRREEIKGGSVEGIWDVLRTDFSQKDTHVLGEHIYPGTLSVMQRMDGIYRLRALKEIRFEKTFSIVAPWRKGEFGDPSVENEVVQESDNIDKSDAERIQDHFGLEDVDDVYKLMPLLHEEYASLEEQNTFFKGFKKENGIWYIPAKEDVSKEVFAQSSEKKLQTLPSTKSEYTTDDVVNEDKEVYPGNKIKLFKNSSVFLMSDDGGIVIGDGYGGEIRMNRGRVSISSIGDIEISPGRDLIEQIPRNRINRTRDRIEFSSTRGSVAVKAEANLNLLSGGVSGGVTTIENRSAQVPLSDIDDESIRQGDAYGSGIICKAKASGVSILGSHIYGGPYFPGDGEGGRTGVDRSTGSCNILFDSGTGSVGVVGRNAVLSFDQSIALTMSTSATSLIMTPTEVLAMCTSQCRVVTPSVTIDRANDLSVDKPAIQSTGIVTDQETISHSDVSFEINGSLYCRGGMQLTGDILSEGQVSANKGCNASELLYPDENTVTILVPEVGYDNDYSKLIKTSSDYLYDIFNVHVVSTGVSTERGQRATDFCFPSSNSKAYRSQDLKFIAPKWQYMLDDSAPVWVEKEIDHPIVGKSYPFPGKDRYEADDALIVKDNSSKHGTKGIPLNNYKTNTSSEAS